MAERPAKRRNPLLAWWIGLAIILAADVIVGYLLTCIDCGANPGLLGFGVLVVIPAVYLTLMYITLKSQADSERQ